MISSLRQPYDSSVVLVRLSEERASNSLYFFSFTNLKAHVSQVEASPETTTLVLTIQRTVGLKN